MLKERQEPENKSVEKTLCWTHVQQTEFNKSKNEDRGKMAEWDKELNSRKVASFSLLWSLSFIYRSRTMDFCWIGFFFGLALFSPQFQHSRGYPVSVTWPLLPGTGKRRKRAGVGGMGWGDGRRSGGSAGFMIGQLNFLSCGAATVQTAFTQISPGCLHVFGSAFVSQMSPQGE